MFILWAPGAIFACTIMKTIFTNTATTVKSDPDGIDLYHWKVIYLKIMQCVFLLFNERQNFRLAKIWKLLQTTKYMRLIMPCHSVFWPNPLHCVCKSDSLVRTQPGYVLNEEIGNSMHVMCLQDNISSVRAQLSCTQQVFLPWIEYTTVGYSVSIFTIVYTTCRVNIIGHNFNGPWRRSLLKTLWKILKQKILLRFPGLSLLPVIISFLWKTLLSWLYCIGV